MMNVTSNYGIRPRTAERHHLDLRITFDDDECALLLKALGFSDILEIQMRLRAYFHKHLQELMRGALKD